MVSLVPAARLFASTLIAITLFSATALAQPGSVCVVDVSQIFQKHTAFNAQLNVLQQKAQQSQLELQQRGQQLEAKSQQLKNISPSSPQYKALETELAQESANLQVQGRAAARGLIQQEAKLHFDTYLEVSHLIAKYCEEHSFRLALRYDSVEMTTDDPESIMRRVNSDVVYHTPNRDITEAIIRLVSQSAGNGPGVGQLPGGSNR